MSDNVYVYADLLFKATQRMTKFTNIYFRKLQMRNFVVHTPQSHHSVAWQGHAFAPRDNNMNSCLISTLLFLAERIRW